MAALEGTGATLTLGATGVSLMCTSIQGQGISWASLDTTHLGTTTAKTFLRGKLYDPGTVAVTFLCEPNFMNELLAITSPQTVTITYPNASTEASSAMITNIDSGSLEVDAVSTASLTLKRTGAVAFVD